MKRIILPLLAAVALLGAPAVSGAQGGPPPPGYRRDSPPPVARRQPPPPNRGWERERPAPPRYYNRWDRPGMRQGLRWQRHVRACRAHYRSYNVRRDAYRSYSGRWIRCRY